MSRVYLVLARHDDPPTEHRAGVRRLVRDHAEYLGLPPDVRVGNTGSGAPYLVGATRYPDEGTDMHISLTHDRNWTAAATSTTPVGVDIQRVEACTSTFRRRLDCTTDREASRSWCIREAITKLRGRGLGDAPWRYRLDANTIDTSGTYEEAHWFCTTLRNDTFLAVATHEPATLHIQEVTHDDHHHTGRHPRPHHLSRPRRLAAI